MPHLLTALSRTANSQERFTELITARLADSNFCLIHLATYLGHEDSFNWLIRFDSAQLQLTDGLGNSVLHLSAINNTIF
jgi:hypothetical protein